MCASSKAHRLFNKAQEGAESSRKTGPNTLTGGLFSPKRQGLVLTPLLAQGLKAIRVANIAKEELVGLVCIRPANCISPCAAGCDKVNRGATRPLSTQPSPFRSGSGSQKARSTGPARGGRATMPPESARQPASSRAPRDASPGRQAAAAHPEGIRGH